MASSFPRGLCQCVGAVSAVLTAVLLVAGFILILAFSSDFDDVSSWSSQYTAGIAAVCTSSLTSLICTVYLCAALKHDWTVFGFLNVSTPDTDLKKVIFPPTQPPPSKPQTEAKPEVTQGDVTSAYYVNHSMFQERSVKRVNAYEIQQMESVENKASTEWDPDTILKDDDMY